MPSNKMKLISAFTTAINGWTCTYTGASVDGVEALNRKLEKLATKTVKAALRKGTRAGAKIVQAKAKVLAPRRTGGLVKGIKVRSMKRSRKYTGTTVRSTGPGYYGSFVNYGTKRQKAQRFLNRAADETHSSATSLAVAVVKDFIEGESAS